MAQVDHLNALLRERDQYISHEGSKLSVEGLALNDGRLGDDQVAHGMRSIAALVGPRIRLRMKAWVISPKQPAIRCCSTNLSSGGKYHSGTKAEQNQHRPWCDLAQVAAKEKELLALKEKHRKADEELGAQMDAITAQLTACQEKQRLARGRKEQAERQAAALEARLGSMPSGQDAVADAERREEQVRGLEWWEVPSRRPWWPGKAVILLLLEAYAGRSFPWNDKLAKPTC